MAALIVSLGLVSTPALAGVVQTCHGRTATIIANGVDPITGTSGPDVIVGSAGNDQIDGGSGNDWICGGAGRDTLTGGPGDDHVYGQDDGDTIVEGQGSDVVSGNAHSLYGDVVTYESASEPLTIDIATHTAHVGSDIDVLTRFDRYFGTNFDDEFIGAAGKDGFFGLDGADHVAGYGGHDYLRGDDGADVVLGGGGADDLAGGLGFDELRDSRGDNVVSDVTLTGASGALIRTGSGNDRVEIQSDDAGSQVSVASGAGADQVFLAGSIDRGRVRAGAGRDRIDLFLLSTADVIVRGEGGNDTLDMRSFEPGDPTLEGVTGIGGPGRDLVMLGLQSGDVVLQLGANGHLSTPFTMSLPGFESAWTGYGDDVITGSPGTNRVFSGDGDDEIFGRAGDDVINASYSTDVVHGGAGKDVCRNAESRFSCEATN